MTESNHKHMETGSSAALIMVASNQDMDRRIFALMHTVVDHWLARWHVAQCGETNGISTPEMMIFAVNTNDIVHAIQALMDVGESFGSQIGCDWMVRSNVKGDIHVYRDFLEVKSHPALDQAAVVAVNALNAMGVGS